MIHKADAQLRRSSRAKTQPAALLNRRVLLAGPAVVLCTKALRAAAPEQRSLVLSLADAAHVRPRNVSAAPAFFNG
jgi:hypothetical protein